MKYCLKSLLFLFPILIFSQNNMGIKFFGLSIHPKGEAKNAHLMPRKFDKDAYLVMNLGAEVMYEHFVYKNIVSVKGIQGLYADCADQLGGFTHIGVRGTIFQKNRHTFLGGIGPTIIYRRNWQHLQGYDNPEFFNGNENHLYQWKFLWYGGELEYKYQLSQKIDFAISFVLGYPDLMSLAFGINYQLK